MKKKKLLVIFVFLFINHNYSQNKKESQDSLAYHEIKNWAVAKLTIAYIEDLKNWNNKTRLKPEDSYQKNEFDSYRKLLNKYSKYSKNVNLDTLYHELSMAWPKTRDNVFKNYKLELVDSVTNFNFENIAFIPSKNSKKETLSEELKKRQKAIQEIKKQFKKTLNSNNTESITVYENNTKNAQDRNSKRTSNSKAFSTFSLVLVLLILSVIINFFLIIRLKSSIKSKRSKRPVKTENNEQFWRNELEKSKRENRNLKAENDRHIKSIKKLQEISSQLNKPGSKYTKKEQIVVEHEVKDCIQESKIQNDESKTENQAILDEEVPITINLDIQKSKTSLLYLPAPFEDSRFASEDASEVKKQTSLYQVEVVENNNEVYFTLIQNIDLSRALNSPNIYLETACEYENIYTTSAKVIEVVEKGIIWIEGEDWIVKKKIKIKFS